MKLNLKLLNSYQVLSTMRNTPTPLTKAPKPNNMGKRII